MACVTVLDGIEIDEAKELALASLAKALSHPRQNSNFKDPDETAGLS